MINADLFKMIFGMYATEIWVKSEQDFLNWLNSSVPSTISKSEIVDCISRKRAIDEGERWLFNLEDKRTIGEMLRDVPSVQPEIKTYGDTISRRQAIDVLYNIDEYNSRSVTAIKNLPSVQSEDWMERNKERILQAGMEGQEIEFRIGGRLFAVREKAQ